MPPDCSVHQAEQRLSSATVNSNGRLQREQCADSSRRVRAALEGAPHSEQDLSGAPRYQSSNGQNRQNPNCWVTWLAHRTVRCAHRQTASPMVELVVGAINTPPTTTTPSIQVFHTSHSIQELVQSIQDTIQKNQNLSKSQLHSKHLVTRERVLLVFFELLFLDRFLFPHSCSLSDL